VAIIDMQRSLVELGRIRIGRQETTHDGKTRPAKLDRFRFTTPSKARAEAVAAMFGGTAQPWSPDAARQEWEVISEVDAIPVVVPPGPAVIDQWYELWSGGGCQRRCDGVTNVLSDSPCACPPDPAERAQLATDGRACRPTTRIRVILRDLPGIGVWRLESHGFYAATELAGSAEFLASASAFGRPLPATLRLEQRATKRGGQTRRYAVPVLDVGATPAELLSAYSTAEIGAQNAAGELPAARSGDDLARRIAAATSMDELKALYDSNRDLLTVEVGYPGTGEFLPLMEVFRRRRDEL
jgi:Recombination directionality factor-like